MKKRKKRLRQLYQGMNVSNVEKKKAGSVIYLLIQRQLQHRASKKRFLIKSHVLDMAIKSALFHKESSFTPVCVWCKNAKYGVMFTHKYQTSV